MTARFKWSAVVSWLEQSGHHVECGAEIKQIVALNLGAKIKGLDIGDEIAIKGRNVR